MKMLIFLAIFVVSCFIICGFYAPITSRFYHIDSTLGVKIAVLSDVHSGTFYNDKIIAILEAQNPDIIVLVGDIIDDDKNLINDDFFAMLDSHCSHILRFYVSGNHEFWSGEIVAIKSMIKARNVEVLDFDNPIQRLIIRGNPISIIGVDDPYVVRYDTSGKKIKGEFDKDWQDLWKDKVKNIFKKLDSAQSKELKSKEFRILLSHRPEFVELFKELDTHLIISGHTHGGQIRIPHLLNGLYAPNQGLLPTYAGGLYSLKDDRSLVVSRGLSLNLKLPRFYNPPEIAFIYI